MTKDIDKKELKKQQRKKEKKERKEKQRNKIDKKTGIKRIVLLVLIIIWAVFVFGFSSQTGEESSGLSTKIANLFFDSEEMIKIAEPIIRKLAHFSEYALGGTLIYLLIDTYEFTNKKKFLISLGIGIWYAAIDELHQTFVPNRSGNIIDVCIDTLGIIVGILFIKLVLMLINKIKNNNIKKQSAN